MTVENIKHGNRAKPNSHETTQARHAKHVPTSSTDLDPIARLQNQLQSQNLFTGKYVATDYLPTNQPTSGDATGATSSFTQFFYMMMQYLPFLSYFFPQLQSSAGYPNFSGVPGSEHHPQTQQVVKPVNGEIVINGDGAANTITGGMDPSGYLFIDVDNTRYWISPQDVAATKYIRVNGGAGADTIDLSAITGIDKFRIRGESGNDTITGSQGNDVLAGGDGDDVIYGKDGNDIIHGGDGSDYIKGGAGNNNDSGDAGNDIVDNH